MKAAFYCRDEFVQERSFDQPSEYEMFAIGYVEGAIAFGAGEEEVHVIRVPEPGEETPETWWWGMKYAHPLIFKDLMERYGQ